MGNTTTYPEAFIVHTARTPSGEVAWGIRDENGKSYDVKEAERLWFAAAEAMIDIDSNLTFARLVQCNFDAARFTDYLNTR